MTPIAVVCDSVYVRVCAYAALPALNGAFPAYSGLLIT
jgi:hypothetical protein